MSLSETGNSIYNWKLTKNNRFDNVSCTRIFLYDHMLRIFFKWLNFQKKKIHENQIICKKLISSDSREKVCCKNIIKSIIFSNLSIFLLENNDFTFITDDW